METHRSEPCHGSLVLKPSDGDWFGISSPSFAQFASVRCQLCVGWRTSKQRHDEHSLAFDTLGMDRATARKRCVVQMGRQEYEIVPYRIHGGQYITRLSPRQSISTRHALDAVTVGCPLDLVPLPPEVPAVVSRRELEEASQRLAAEDEVV